MSQSRSEATQPPGGANRHDTLPKNPASRSFYRQQALSHMDNGSRIPQLAKF